MAEREKNGGTAVFPRRRLALERREGSPPSLTLGAKMRVPPCRAANPSERKKVPHSVKKGPKLGFFYVRTFDKVPNAQK